jgi:hypothetical protein
MVLFISAMCIAAVHTCIVIRLRGFGIAESAFLLRQMHFSVRNTSELVSSFFTCPMYYKSGVVFDQIC